MAVWLGLGLGLGLGRGLGLGLGLGDWGWGWVTGAVGQCSRAVCGCVAGMSLSCSRGWIGDHAGVRWL